MTTKKQNEANPINKDEKDRQAIHPERQDPAKAIQSDILTTAQQNIIVDLVMQDVEVGRQAYQDWKAKKDKDLQQINAEKPSIMEGTPGKKSWMSDRNLGLVPGLLDIYQATLLSTSFNPETIHFKDTEKNDVNNRDNLEKFTKWAVSKREMDFAPEVDDFINNRVSLGFSAFEIHWEIKNEWVDKRIPVYGKKQPNQAKRVIRYDIEEENRRFERGWIENIDDPDDLLLPSYGDDFQKLPFIIRINHNYLSDIAEMEKRLVIVTKFDKSKEAKTEKETISGATMPKLQAAPSQSAQSDTLRAQRAIDLGIAEVVDPVGRDFPIEILKWFGYLTLNGKREKYRVLVEPTTRTFLSAKPLRKIRRDGKFPFVGGPLRRVPGQIRGKSLTSLIAPLTDALNNNYNQTSDFQYVQNLPFGFANFSEGFTQSIYDVDPGKIYDVDGNPNESVYFPNLSRSLAWSYQDKQFLMEMIERLTGAASYFLTSQSKDATATRDSIVHQTSETKFGLWVYRIQEDIAEALNMAISLYQDWAPPELATRVLGEDGKTIIKNLSINSLRGNYDAYMVPDLTSGSKAYERQVMLWASQVLTQTCVWMSPQMNPRGNWLLWKEVMRSQGIENPDYYLPPMPKVNMDSDEEAIQEFSQFKAGETISDPPEGVTPAVVRHYMTHMKQKETEYQDLDEEYRQNFDDHLMKTAINYKKFMDQVVQEHHAMQVAAAASHNLERLGLKPAGSAPAQPGKPPAPMMTPPDNGGLGAGMPVEQEMAATS